MSSSSSSSDCDPVLNLLTIRTCQRRPKIFEEKGYRFIQFTNRCVQECTKDEGCCCSSFDSAASQTESSSSPETSCSPPLKLSCTSISRPTLNPNSTSSLKSEKKVVLRSAPCSIIQLPRCPKSCIKKGKSRKDVNINLQVNMPGVERNQDGCPSVMVCNLQPSKCKKKRKKKKLCVCPETPPKEVKTPKNQSFLNKVKNIIGHKTKRECQCGKDEVKTTQPACFIPCPKIKTTPQCHCVKDTDCSCSSFEAPPPCPCPKHHHRIDPCHCSEKIPPCSCLPGHPHHSKRKKGKEGSVKFHHPHEHHRESGHSRHHRSRSHPHHHEEESSSKIHKHHHHDDDHHKSSKHIHEEGHSHHKSRHSHEDGHHHEAETHHVENHHHHGDGRSRHHYDEEEHYHGHSRHHREVDHKSHHEPDHEHHHEARSKTHTHHHEEHSKHHAPSKIHRSVHHHEEPKHQSHHRSSHHGGSGHKSAHQHHHRGSRSSGRINRISERINIVRDRRSSELDKQLTLFFSENEKETGSDYIQPKDVGYAFVTYRKLDPMTRFTPRKVPLKVVETQIVFVIAVKPNLIIVFIVCC